MIPAKGRQQVIAMVIGTYREPTIIVILVFVTNEDQTIGKCRVFIIEFWFQ